MLGLALLACSSESTGPGAETGAGGSASGTGGSTTSAGGSTTSAGATSAGTSSGGTGAGGTSAGGSNAMAGAAAGGGGSVNGGSATGGTASGSGGIGGSEEVAGASGEGGADGSDDQPVCIIESLHLKVSGGMTFDRTTHAEDICGVSFGGESGDADLTFFVMPPEVENTILIPIVVPDLAPGQTGTFTPNPFSVLTTGAIWSIHLPDAENPLKCSVKLTKSENTNGKLWRVAGSVTCPTALSGIGPIGMTPLSLNDFSFSVLTDAVGAVAP